MGIIAQRYRCHYPSPLRVPEPVKVEFPFPFRISPTSSLLTFLCSICAVFSRLAPGVAFVRLAPTDLAWKPLNRPGTAYRAHHTTSTAL
jgi:hypothetical protein